MIWNKQIYDNLTNCASLCDISATDFSQASNIEEWSRLIFLSLDCADICRQVGVLYVRGSENTRLIASACIDVCQKCVDEAGRFNHSRCEQIGLLCRHTMDSCRRIMNMTVLNDSLPAIANTAAFRFYGIDLRETLYN